jgi:hypothetical protein
VTSPPQAPAATARWDGGTYTFPYTSCGRSGCDCPWDCEPSAYAARSVDVHIDSAEDSRCEDVDHADVADGGKTP